MRTRDMTCLRLALAVFGILASGLAGASVVYRFETVYDPYKEYFDEVYPGEGLTSEFEGMMVVVDDDVWRGKRLNVSAETAPTASLEDGSGKYITPWFGAYLNLSNEIICFDDLCDPLGLNPGDRIMLFEPVFDGFAFTDLKFGRYLRGSRLSTDDGRDNEWQIAFVGGAGNLWTSQYRYDDGMPPCHEVDLPGLDNCGGVVGRFVLDRSTVPTPEPGTLALLGLGLAGLGMSRRRRKVS